MGGGLYSYGSKRPSNGEKFHIKWHLVNLKTKKMVHSYSHLSRIMASSGWFFYLTPDRKFWCTWKAQNARNVQYASLPYPDLGAATKGELQNFVSSLQSAGLKNIFDVQPGYVSARGVRKSIDNGNVKVSLSVRATNRQIDTYKDLAEVLIVNGWTRVNDCHYYRFEPNPVATNCYVISVINMPLHRTFHEVSLEDLESIVLLTGSLFFLHYSRNVLSKDRPTASPQSVVLISAPNTSNKGMREKLQDTVAQFQSRSPLSPRNQSAVRISALNTSNKEMREKLHDTVAQFQSSSPLSPGNQDPKRMLLPTPSAPDNFQKEANKKLEELLFLLRQKVSQARSVKEVEDPMSEPATDQHLDEYQKKFEDIVTRLQQVRLLKDEPINSDKGSVHSSFAPEIGRRSKKLEELVARLDQSSQTESGHSRTETSKLRQSSSHKKDSESDFVHDRWGNYLCTQACSSATKEKENFEDVHNRCVSIV